MNTALNYNIYSKSFIKSNKKVRVLVQVSVNGNDWQNYIKTEEDPYVEMNKYQLVILDIYNNLSTKKFYFFRLHIVYADGSDISPEDVELLYIGKLLNTTNKVVEKVYKIIDYNERHIHETIENVASITTYTEEIVSMLSKITNIMKVFRFVKRR